MIATLRAVDPKDKIFPIVQDLLSMVRNSHSIEMKHSDHLVDREKFLFTQRARLKILTARKQNIPQGMRELVCELDVHTRSKIQCASLVLSKNATVLVDLADIVLNEFGDRILGCLIFRDLQRGTRSRGKTTE